ncbi:HlyD family efflux transporter periplasmic adaptor subunit [Roseateles violae]|uniref:Efflux RND transporter periplasmic adaptor subunit n=1 Tax=Roseateles violae TaxID=3058042 RepID=A0ABT8DXQ1_9BURK|nr:HlyD family efflux transporter periplasmic adaptor subunit [Pelomonas sp. PFR6]MDN3921526.1 efflux RND transporter periplasmic adaptor subunit [Pelomonas sp. PFR6]
MSPLPPQSAQTALPADAWQLLAQARSGDQLAQAWLTVLCQALLKARAGLVLMAQPDGAYAPVAALPPARELHYLADIATEALRQRAGVLRHNEAGEALLAYPLTLAASLAGAVVLDLGPADAAAAERARQLTHWGAGWLMDLMRRLDQARSEADARRARFLLDTVLALQNEAGTREAAIALVHAVGRELDCRQVQLALAEGGKKTLRRLAVSHAAVSDDRSRQAVQALQAMHEAYDQGRPLVWPEAPAADGGAARITAGHARYASEAGAKALCGLPLTAAHETVGVLLLERDTPFTAEEVELLEALGAAVGPLLLLQGEAGQGVAGRALRSLRRGLGRVTDSSHPALKLGLGAAALLLVLLAVVPVPYRVTAGALVEGAQQRAAVAPFEGYVREAPARAGDTVKAGQLLARLEDKDLLLEKTRWESELDVALRKEREAMARSNRVDQRQAAAQANQARAQLELAGSKLERVAITAPFDGIVVKGDLSQQLGSPVEQGKVLFEIAPLNAWRVILKVDERDIGRVQTGAAGTLVLASLPGQDWPFTVKKITPVSVPEDGRNQFRVEAELGGEAPKLSPNMEGVGKIEVGRASLLWAWTHPLLDWARLAWWKLLP